MGIYALEEFKDKEIPLNNIFSVDYVIKASNLIIDSLNERVFILRRLCRENNEHLNRLLLHVEVRWLSKGTCMDRFYKLLIPCKSF